MRTRTYAEILARQQEYGEALSIYRDLLQRKPDDEGIKARISELERLEREAQGDIPEAVPDDAKLAKLAKLEVLLQRVLTRKRRRRPPPKSTAEAKPKRAPRSKPKAS